MSCCIYYKFKSQKELSRIKFDGSSGLNLFDVKREILRKGKFSNGSDFDIKLYNADTNEEYEDDEQIITHGTSVIVRRVPTAKGHGSAAKYLVDGASTKPKLDFMKRPVINKNPVIQNNKATAAKGNRTNSNEEDYAIEQMIALSSQQWDKVQSQMETKSAVSAPRRQFAPANVPENPPPSGYVCYRCGQVGHWIQACPTNNDPEWDQKPRIKRTTGIPRSFLKTVANPLESGEKLNNVMVNADGDFVQAVPNSKSWENYQSQIKKKESTISDVFSRPATEAEKEKGYNCNICQRLQKDSSLTPCCGNTFCDECLQQALLDSDFVCPACAAKDIFLDRIKPDEMLRKEITKHALDIVGITYTSDNEEEEERNKNGSDKDDKEGENDEADKERNVNNQDSNIPTDMNYMNLPPMDAFGMDMNQFMMPPFAAPMMMMMPPMPNAMPMPMGPMPSFPPMMYPMPSGQPDYHNGMQDSLINGNDLNLKRQNTHKASDADIDNKGDGGNSSKRVRQNN